MSYECDVVGGAAQQAARRRRQDRLVSERELDRLAEHERRVDAPTREHRRRRPGELRERSESAAAPAVIPVVDVEDDRPDRGRPAVETSRPLACQKRVAAVTYWSYGAWTNTRTVRPLPSGSS